MITRPTTRPFYTLDIQEDEITVQHNEPSLQKRMIELHLGLGPGALKSYLLIFAAGLLFIMLSGLWLGLSSVDYARQPRSFPSGLALFLWLAVLTRGCSL